MMDFGILISAMSLLAAGISTAAAAPMVPSAVIAKCQSCHGANGDSTFPTIPRLNGQHAAYLEARLKSFLDPGRQDPHATDAMWGVVRQINDTTLASVAQYYADQPPGALAANESLLAQEGKQFYGKGDAGEFIPPCASCHGANGEGQGAIPRLAGQHGAYLKSQLERLCLNLRANGTMHPKSNNMTNPQIDALVAYLSKD